MRKIIKLTAANITTDGLVLNANITTKTVYNGERDAFCICVNLPTTATVLPVFISIGSTTVPLLDAFGNTLYSDQIKCRTLYVGVWGTNELHFRLFTCTPRSQTTATQVNIA